MENRATEQLESLLKQERVFLEGDGESDPPFENRWLEVRGAVMRIMRIKDFDVEAIPSLPFTSIRIQWKGSMFPVRYLQGRAASEV